MATADSALDGDDSCKGYLDLHVDRHPGPFVLSVPVSGGTAVSVVNVDGVGEKMRLLNDESAFICLMMEYV